MSDDAGSNCRNDGVAVVSQMVSKSAEEASALIAGSKRSPPIFDA